MSGSARSMADLILVRGARQLLTLQGAPGPRRGAACRDLGLIRDGALLIRDGIIHDVGPSRRVENLAAARYAVEIDADRRVVLPGFVDSHSHLALARPLLEDSPNLQGPDEPREPRASSAGDEAHIRNVCGSRLQAAAKRFHRNLLRHGTTTLGIRAGGWSSDAVAVKALRVAAALHEHPLDLAATYLGGHGSAAASAVLLLRLRRLKLAQFAELDCEETGRDEARAREFLRTARDLGFPLRVHCDQRRHAGGARLAAEFQAITADHLDFTGRDELRLLAHSNTIAALTPGPALCSGSDHYPAARFLIDEGAAVCLASGFEARACPLYSMQTALALACLRMGMTAAEAITAATINGAHSLLMAHRVGSLEPGKRADLLIMNASDYRELPLNLGGNGVCLSMKRGAVLYRETECPEN